MLEETKTTNDIEIMEMCRNCFYYENKSSSNSSSNKNVKKQKVMIFIECDSCAKALRTLDSCYA